MRKLILKQHHPSHQVSIHLGLRPPRKDTAGGHFPHTSGAGPQPLRGRWVSGPGRKRGGKRPTSPHYPTPALKPPSGASSVSAAGCRGWSRGGGASPAAGGGSERRPQGAGFPLGSCSRPALPGRAAVPGNEPSPSSERCRLPPRPAKAAAAREPPRRPGCPRPPRPAAAARWRERAGPGAGRRGWPAVLRVPPGPAFRLLSLNEVRNWITAAPRKPPAPGGMAPKREAALVTCGGFSPGGWLPIAVCTSKSQAYSAGVLFSSIKKPFSNLFLFLRGFLTRSDHATLPNSYL